MKPKRIGILTTHPIQYQAPWFRGLAQCSDFDVNVYFCHQPSDAEQASAGFSVEFQWDVPILSGYQFHFLRNVARQPSISTFRGLDVPEIANIIDCEHYDAFIVSGWNYLGAWQAFHASWKTRTPIMVRGDSHLNTRRNRLKRTLKYPVYRWFIQRMDACLAVGSLSRDYFLHYGAPADRVFQVHHVIDEARFELDRIRLAPIRNQLRNQYAITEDNFVVGFCGKLVTEKRPFDFIEAVATAHKNDPRIVGLIVGDGPLKEACITLATSKDAPIHFAGFLNQTQIATAYIGIDCLVLPSDSETWGMVVNEAMYFGCPCIVSHTVGCAPDVVVPGVSGDIYTCGDIATLSNIILSYASNVYLCSQLREGTRKIISNYSVNAAVNGMRQAVERVIL